jgi:regulatory protein
MTESALYKTALSKAMAQCSKREYCTEDIRSKLELWGVGSADTERIIAALIKENFINESRYASAFVRDKFRYNKWGKIKIAAHLRIKKIPSDKIRTALESIDYEVYIKVLRELIEKHKKSIKAKNQYALKAKLLRYGLSKGFESTLIYELLNENDD